jgi:hypothetical protein
VIANPMMEINLTMRRFGSEIGGDIVDSERHKVLLHYC